MTNAATDSSRFISWVHFGDLHIRAAADENYETLLELIEHANGHLAGSVDFAFLPGDNADDGTTTQYRLVRKALDRLQLPAEAIAGDHDALSGDLNSFQQYLEPDLYRARDLQGYRLLFLNALDGKTPKSFDIGTQQLEWLRGQLSDARIRAIQPVVFLHLYPSELETRADELIDLLRAYGVLLVEMGHTHYNELANDGHIVYAATRSTGQIEEGPPGFSITTLDHGVVSWKFKEIGPWPFVMITSPSDEKLITDPENRGHIARGVVSIRAGVWNQTPVERVMCQIDDEAPRNMQSLGDGCGWVLAWDSSEAANGTHQIRVCAYDNTGHEAEDTISTWVCQAGLYQFPRRNPVDLANSIGAYPSKGILGTQLGPNKNGTKVPWPSWRTRPSMFPVAEDALREHSLSGRQ